ncbi:L,D-transpeptidase [Cereibacter sphaeroides]|uniref:L,D-transpeptidase n=1 Tax=Rhodobacterales TaxID=204455 RepID=UPI0018E0B92C|nr:MULTISPECIES: L,D-transpeptidase [Paracoccaceae]MCE6959520.1 L,D-transpeptidase [Cereibacter sphaeroides]MCE6973709.1 L,D-transpeptidase [Cereibacter sphaeroides]
MTVTGRILSLALFALLPFLAACASAPAPMPPQDHPLYPGIQDGEFFIQPVPTRYLTPDTVRQEVPYAGSEKPGTIVVDSYARRLYFVTEEGKAMRYAIAVGRQGLAFRGNAKVGRKREWPSWQPTLNMLRTQPEMYRPYAAGLPGGLENPLGARALYLYRGGRDTMFRIHGTVQNSSIGHATSAGCIRLFNQDAIDLYNRTNIGTPVKVRSESESLALEGPFHDDEYGRATPGTAEALTAEEEILLSGVPATAR